MLKPTPFGIMLKQAREKAKLSQGELAEELNKTAQYISNIEKGKNNSPPDDADIQKLTVKLSLNDADSEKFRLLAYADRGMLPPEMFDYVLNCGSLLSVIRKAMNTDLPDSFWDSLLKKIN